MTVEELMTRLRGTPEALPIYIEVPITHGDYRRMGRAADWKADDEHLLMRLTFELTAHGPRKGRGRIDIPHVLLEGR